MKYRIHLTAGSNGLPVSETRQRIDAALTLCETLARNVIRANGGLIRDGEREVFTDEGDAFMQKVFKLDDRGGTVSIYNRLLILTPSRS